MPRALLVLALVALASGCIAGAAPPAPPDPAEPPAPVTAAPEPLLLSWSPTSPAPGDIVRLRIETPVHFPPPRCDVTQIDVEGQGDMRSFDMPAPEDGDGYACAFTVSEWTDVLVLGASRQDSGRLRILRSQVLEVERPAAPPRQTLGFQLDAREDGVPLAVAHVPLALVNVQTPQAGDLFPMRNSTHGRLLWSLATSDGRVASAGMEWVEWTGPDEAATPMDARARILELERAWGTDLAEDEPIIRALAWFWNDRAYAVSDVLVQGYDRCAQRECFTLEG